MKRQFSVPAVFMCAVLVFATCAASSQTASNSGSPATASSSRPDAPDTEWPVTVVVREYRALLVDGHLYAEGDTVTFDWNPEWLEVTANDHVLLSWRKKGTRPPGLEVLAGEPPDSSAEWVPPAAETAAALEKARKRVREYSEGLTDPSPGAGVWMFGNFPNRRVTGPKAFDVLKVLKAAVAGPLSEADRGRASLLRIDGAVADIRKAAGD